MRRGLRGGQAGENAGRGDAAIMDADACMVGSTRAELLFFLAYAAAVAPSQLCLQACVMKPTPPTSWNSTTTYKSTQRHDTTPANLNHSLTMPSFLTASLTFVGNLSNTRCNPTFQATRLTCISSSSVQYKFGAFGFSLQFLT